MDIKKIDKIKAPEDWVEEALNPEKIQGISHRRNSMKKLRTAAAAVVIFLLCGTFVTVAATKSNVFQSLLENMFGKENVTEVELNPEPTKQVADVKAEKDGTIQLQENMMVVGEKESFISEYHFEGDEEKVDHVYTVVSNGLKKMTPVAFESVLDGEKCGFQYVASGNEIYAFNYTGGITEIFSYYKNGIIYGVREEKNATKGYLVEINLAEKMVKKISGGNMICNFVMSPEGSKILCNHRGDGYWSVFDIASQTEKKISQKLVNGYARTTEIEFLDENRILTYGESIFKNSTEEDSTCVVNLQTMRIEKKYSGVGLVNMKWSYRYHHKKKSLEFYEITGNQSFTIPDVKDSGDVIDVSGDYVLFGNLEEKKQAVYLIQLTNHTWKKMNIPGKLRNDMEIHLVKTQKKILITNKKRAYLVDVSAL